MGIHQTEPARLEFIPDVLDGFPEESELGQA